MQRLRYILNRLRGPGHPYHKDVNRFPLLPATVVFVTLLIILMFTWRSAIRTIDDEQHAQVVTRAQSVESSIQSRLSSFADILYAASGFVSSSTEVPSVEEWAAFARSLNLSRYPSVLAIGYAPQISATNRVAFEQQVQSSGVPGYTIRPATGGDTLAPVLLQEPSTAAFPVTSFDMLSESSRRIALERARDTGMPSLTTPIVLLPDRSDPQPGMIMVVPVYRNSVTPPTTEKRRQDIIGYVFLPFRNADLFKHAVTVNESDFGFKASTGSTQLYHSAGLDNRPELTMETSRELQVYGQSWKFDYFGSKALVARTIQARPSAVFFGGLIFALSVTLSVYLLVRRRILDQAYMEDMKLQSAKDDLLSLASHQLRTPATGVKQYLGMVLQGYMGSVDPSQEKMLRLAYESNERQLRIINEFLYMAKADAGRIIITPQRFNLTKLVDEVLGEQASDIAEAGHTVTRHLASNSYVHGDPHSIRMIVENLISNAIKYTPRGGAIDVRLKRDKKHVTLTVTDNGVGIQPKDMPLLFKQFSRIPNALTQITSGSGIGLYLAKHLAELNDAEITVDSKPNEGSTFTARFKSKSVKNITSDKSKLRA